MNATMNAHALTGTFVWKFGYSTGIALYAINFFCGSLRAEVRSAAREPLTFGCPEPSASIPAQ